MRLITLLIVCCVLSGCATNGYKDFYVSGIDLATEVGERKDLTIEVLQPNQEPQIIETNDLNSEYQNYTTKRYIIIGHSSFNGEYEDKQNVIKQAKRVGATLVLVKSEYTNTQTSTTALQLPNTQTNYHSGSVYGGGGVANYSGTTTTSGTTAIPITTHQRRYDQEAWFLVKASYIIPPKIDFYPRDLSVEERIEIERNTGVVVATIYEDTPMFYANVLRGDIIIAVNGVQVKNSAQWGQLSDGITGKSTTLTILRKGVQKDLVVQFDAPNDK
jgi:serine protease Do